MPPTFETTTGIRRKTNAWLLVLVLLGWLFASRSDAAQDTNALSVSGVVITNMTQYWLVAANPAERNQVHPVRMELLVYYCDPGWRVFWGESDGLLSFLPFNGLPTPLQSGSRILVEGLALPVNQEFYWDKTRIQVLSESNTLTAIAAGGRLLDANDLKGRFVETEAMVDSATAIGTNYLRLTLLAGDVNVDAVVHLDQPYPAGQGLVGKMVRVRGVYAVAYDPFGRIANLTLWTPGMAYVQIIGSLADDPRFSAPLLHSEDFVDGAQAGTPSLVRVRGVVRSQQRGEAVTIWDATGQIRILAKQRQPLQRGDRIEAVGYPSVQDLDRILQTGLFRVVTNTEPGDYDRSTNVIKLRLADQVRGLDQEAIARHPAASLQGIVTCLDRWGRFIFVQDSSGGIRVAQTTLFSGRAISPGMLVTVEGMAAMGEFAPLITNAVVRQTGALDLPDPPLISLEQARTGTEDGDWIEMRGYVRQATVESNSVELKLVGPSGEFTARMSPDDASGAPEGSVVLVRGVCVAIANARRQLTRIEVWSDTSGSIQSEQAALADPFALPIRSIASLRQFNLFNTLNERVRTAGTVTFQSPGRYLVVQDGDSSLLALTDQTEPLRPGDRVEIVGFSGNADGNFLLREAIYRRVAAGPEPQPLTPAALQTADETLDGLLVRLDGGLLESVHESGETRLVMQLKGHIFGAKLEGEAALAGSEPAPGSRLAVTGVYRIERDESGKPLSFVVNLRNPGDVRVLAPPPWWTLRRLLFIGAGVLPVFLLALGWALQTRRKNRQLQRAQVELRIAHDELEERVATRTRELNDEVEARQRALARLSEAQQRLILASRQAGMAEVATGILHNVGNILNSVNVSATVIGDSLQKLRIEKFSQAAELLETYQDQWVALVADDARGRALPSYLRQLSANMVQNEQGLRAEVKALIKQVDHVKAVIAWQQGHARSSGLYEKLDAAELMEDALRINQAAYERHGIQVVREFAGLPPILADRHKILQILINLLRNAKQALAAAANKDKRVFLRIHALGEGQVRFEVADTGEGISPENLGRIFSLGFSTKPTGHGFGLHSGANSAQEMGGRLFATSEGVGRGATFVLELPVAPLPERRAPVEVQSP